MSKNERRWCVLWASYRHWWCMSLAFVENSNINCNMYGFVLTSHMGPIYQLSPCSNMNIIINLPYITHSILLYFILLEVFFPPTENHKYCHYLLTVILCYFPLQADCYVIFNQQSASKGRQISSNPWSEGGTSCTNSMI